MTVNLADPETENDTARRRSGRSPRAAIPTAVAALLLGCFATREPLPLHQHQLQEAMPIRVAVRFEGDYAPSVSPLARYRSDEWVVN